MVPGKTTMNDAIATFKKIHNWVRKPVDKDIVKSIPKSFKSTPQQSSMAGLCCCFLNFCISQYDLPSIWEIGFKYIFIIYLEKPISQLQFMGS